jgi:16S rRNA (cytosine1402-N4)-methyltransferase
MSEYKDHYPVLLQEVLEALNPAKNKKFIDCTFGFGGHSKEILKNGGEVLGIEWDKDVIGKFEKIDGLILEQGNYANIDEFAKKHNFNNVDGILIDLGLSSWDLDKSNRGFSFKNSDVLDMRYDQNNQKTASDILNDYTESELIEIFQEYGEIRSARKFAKQICDYRKQNEIKTVDDLNLALGDCSKKCLAMIYQALRIETNHELDNLKTVLPKAWDLLKNNGILVIISFHSLEDRIVKNYFKDKKIQGSGELLTKKPQIAKESELAINKRSASAKLRAIRKI